MTSNKKVNSQQKAVVLNSDDVVLSGVLSIFNKQSSNYSWKGTMTGFSDVLRKNISKNESKVLPGSPSALRVVLNRIVNRLRSRGVSVKFGRTPDYTRTRFVEFKTR